MDLSRLAAHDPVSVTGPAREAAVLVAVVERSSGPAVLFVKRADHLGEHAGQMAFPGGGREPEDEDLLATALRESHEEVGLDPSLPDVVGRLDDIPTISDYSVRPFVARIPDVTFVPDGREVAEVAVLPVEALTDRANYDSEHRDHPERGSVRIHYFRVDGYTVWGATGQMLVQFLELATDWRMPPEPDRVVDPDAEFPV
jgi:8-oxo-dGTP pyrophosphatase MutT (NUDIX family)